jgi:hypothetical protein
VISNEVYKTSKSLYIPRQLKGPNGVVREKDLRNLSGNGQVFLIVVNSAGMGKTSLLNHLAEEMKDRYATHWIINIALNDHTRYFEQNVFQTPESIADFLLNDLLKLESSFADRLFREAFLNVGNVQIILDGLDEIAPNYTDPVMTLMKTLQGLPAQKIIISTRPELGERLEKEFEKKRFEILPFTREEQEAFLLNSWKADSKNSEAELQKFSAKLLDSINPTIADEDFTGTPLTTKLVADIYKNQAQRGLVSDKIEGATSLYELLYMFLKEKIRINNEEKTKLDPSNVQAIRLIDTDTQMLNFSCQKLALPKVFSSEELIKFPKNDYTKLTSKEYKIALKYGLITGQLGSEKFIHKTFAEYFALLYVIKRLHQEEVFLFFVRVILTEKRFQVNRAMFDSCMNEIEFNSQISHFNSLSSKFDEYSSALNVACNEGNSKTAELLFLFLIDTSDPQELAKFQKSLTEKNSFLIPYMFKVDNKINILEKINEKFGIEFVREIFRSKFLCHDGSETDLFSCVLLNGRNSLPDSKFLDFDYFQADKFDSNFIQNVVNSKSSKQKVEVCKAFLKIQKSDQIDSTAISNFFQEHLTNSDPKNSLLLDALKVGNIEAFKLFTEFVSTSVDTSEFWSRFLRFYLCEFNDQFNVLQVLRECLDSDSVKNILKFDQNLLCTLSKSNEENCLKFVKFLLEHFDEDLNCLESVFLGQDEFGKVLLQNLLDSDSPGDSICDFIRKLKHCLDSDAFKKFILISTSQDFSFTGFMDFGKTRVIQFHDVIGLDLARELVVRGIRNFSQSQDHDLIDTFYRTILNYFDEKIDQEVSSFEQLKLEAFRQLSIDHNFSSFMKLEKK